MFSDLPVPKRKFSWLITVVLLVVSFYLYYGFFYQKFVDVYSDGIYQSSEFESDNFNGSVMLPKSISAFVARPVRVQIINDLKGEKSQTIEDLTVSVYSEPVEKNVQRISSLMFDPKKYVLENSYVIDQFQPYEIVEFEIPIQAKADQKIVIYATFPEKDNNNSDILTYQTELLSFSAPNLSYKPVQTYVQVAIEYLLMPPISNGLLPVLVAFVVYSMEYRRKEEDELKDIKKSYTKDINQGVATFIFSSILLGAFYCILSVVFDVTEDLSKVVVRYSDWGARWPWMIFCGILICYFVYWIYHARITVGILIEDGWPVEQEFQVKNRIALGSYFCIIGFFCTTFYLGMKLGKELLGLDFWVSVLLMLVWLLVFIFSSFRKILNWSVTNRNCAKLYSAINILLFFYGIFVLINMKILGWHLLLIFLVVILR